MEQKRQYPHEEEGESSVQTLGDHHSKRPRQSETLGTSIIGFGSLFALSHDYIAPRVENLFRTVVSEELAHQISRLESNETTGTCEARFFRLYFMNDMPATIFTHSKIKAKDDTPIKVALYDTRSMSIVSEGPLSSIKVKICVLHSDFGSDGSDEEWSEDQFKDKIALQRKNKGELLKGNVVITLKDGVAEIHYSLVFTDNSSWTRSRHFRLGAFAVESNLNKDANIREAVSTPFMVKDCRGETNLKRFPPIVTDEVWQLKRISKDGKIHRRLTEHGVNSVGDLLELHATDPSSWKKIFAKIPKKNQEAIIEHAKTSVADQGQNCINSQNILNSQEKVVVASTSTISIQTAQYGALDQALQQLINFTQQEENHEQMMNWDRFGPSASTYNNNELIEEIWRESESHQKD